MKVSINTFAYANLSLNEGLRLMSRAGFKYVSFDAVSPPGIKTGFGLHTESCLEATRQLLDRYSMQVDWVHLPFTETPCLTTMNPEELLLFQSAFIHLIKSAGELGARSVVMHIFKPLGLFSPEAIDRAGRKIISSVEPLIEASDAAGVRLAVENTALIDADPAPMQRIIEKLMDHFPTLGFCFDRGHGEVINEEDFYFPRYADRLVALHLHDNLGYMDRHLLPGEGVIDWPAFAALMKKSGYDGIYGLEVGAKNGTFAHLPPAEFFAEAYRRACMVAEGKEPPGPYGGKYPYAGREYNMERTGRSVQFGTFKGPGGDAPIRFEVAAGTDWDGKDFGATPPEVSDGAICAERHFTLVTRIDKDALAGLHLSCRIETENLRGSEVWESASILAIVFDRQGAMIEYGTLAMITGTGDVEVKRRVPLHYDLVDHVEIWIRKHFGTTGRCRFSNLVIRELPHQKNEPII